MDVTEQLKDGIHQMNLSLSDSSIEKLVAYLKLLDKWNSHFNLTAIRDIHQMVSLHLLDSLAVLPYVKANQVLDVGTGAGLPGIPLAICMPDVHFTLLDSNVKKTRFLTQAKIELALSNVDVVKQRIEQYHPSIEFDVIISRAFASISDMVNNIKQLVGPATRILAMKADATDEIAALPTAFTIDQIYELTVPGLDARRQLVDIRQTQA